jgi:hypothetical protein
MLLETQKPITVYGRYRLNDWQYETNIAQVMKRWGLRLIRHQLVTETIFSFIDECDCRWLIACLRPADDPTAEGEYFQITETQEVREWMPISEEEASQWIKEEAQRQGVETLPTLTIDRQTYAGNVDRVNMTVTVDDVTGINRERHGRYFLEATAIAPNLDLIGAVGTAVSSVVRNALHGSTERVDPLAHVRRYAEMLG